MTNNFEKIGIIMYELLFDDVPFYSESLMDTYAKIMDHEVWLNLFILSFISIKLNY